MERGVFVTVNTDAGYSYKHRKGTFAYWIKGTGQHLHGSGMIKELHDGKPGAGPYTMEIKAVLNALAAIKKTKHPPIIGFIFNRDNIHVNPGKKGDEYQRMLTIQLRHFRKDAEKRTGKYIEPGKYAQFRHVKAHSGTDTARKWVNDWLDRQCKIRFQEWYDANIKPKDNETNNV